MRVCVWVGVYVCACVCMCVCVYVCMCMCAGFVGSEAHTLLVSTLTDMGYHIQQFVLSPEQFGVPYFRPRCVCVCVCVCAHHVLIQHARDITAWAGFSGITHTHTHIRSTQKPRTGHKISWLCRPPTCVYMCVCVGVV